MLMEVTPNVLVAVWSEAGFGTSGVRARASARVCVRACVRAALRRTLRVRRRSHPFGKAGYLIVDVHMDVRADVWAAMRALARAASMQNSLC